MPDSPWPHRMAVLLVCATFPLIWVGGLVTTYNAGMAVPDWPTTYGYNMFLYPWQTWVLGPFDLFIEHGHRLLGALVGCLMIAMVMVVRRRDSRSWVTVLAAAGLVLVIFQGLLGGMRVLGNDVQLAKLHGIVGPAFFALTVALAVVTSRRWRESVKGVACVGAAKIHRLAIITTGLVYLQLIVGAHLRHLPVDFTPGAFRAVVFFHLFLAVALLFHMVLLSGRVIVKYRQQKAVLVPACTLSVLLLLQIALGSATWVSNYSWPAWAAEYSFAVGHLVVSGSYVQALIVTAHQAMGSLILGNALLLTMRAMRFIRASSEAATSSVAFKGVLA